jgi:glycosyltransferase involved in cell wall biosynthesis
MKSVLPINSGALMNSHQHAKPEGAIAGAPRVQVVAPTDAWILERMGRELVQRIPFVRISPWKPELQEPWDIAYFVNYALYQPVPNARLVGGYFTHKESDQFEAIARQLDFTVNMSRKYASVLKNVSKVNFVIPPGVDLESFVPRIRLAVAGRFYPSGRKGEDLLARVRSLPYVEILFSGGNLTPDQLPAFYNSADYVFIPASIEGGPMSLLEGLACGKEIIAPDVGMVPEFHQGILRYERERPESLVELLEELYSRRLKIRKNVESYSWKNFARRHQELFLSLTQGR